jgi:glycosyltransferase involved in cell wall biosynthesis
MLGTLPPWRGVAAYTGHIVTEIDAIDSVDLEFIDFTSLYPRFLYPGGDPVDPSGRKLELKRVTVRRLLAWYNPLTWIWAGLTLRGQVVHAQWWTHALAPIYLVVLGLARLRGRRVVLTVHNVVPHDSSRWQQMLYKMVMRLADHFVVHAQRNVNALTALHHRAAGKTSVIPHGPNTGPREGAQGKPEARQALGLAGSDHILLAFGNIRPYKGLDVLLRATRRVLDAGRNVTLVVAGQPWGDFEPYHKLIADLRLERHVRMHLGFIPEADISTFFAAADLAVYPYLQFDAQSGAAIDALAHGVPAVVSDVGGLPDLVPDRRAVVPPNDPAALADALVSLLDDGALRERLARDSQRLAQELGWDRIAARTARLYQTLLA